MSVFIPSRLGAFLGRLGGRVRTSAPWREWTGRDLEPLDGPPPRKATTVTRAVIWRIDRDGTIRTETAYRVRERVP